MKKLFFPISLLLLSGCIPKTGDQFDSLGWLVGKWERTGTTENTRSIEHWSRQDDQSYQGYGTSIEGNDTLFYERLWIELDEENLYYVADVGEGNVRFKLTSSSDIRWVFSNPDHDFPKKIIYTRKGLNQLLVTIAGGDRTVDFEFARSENGE